jgi:hypothetical protein
MEPLGTNIGLDQCLKAEREECTTMAFKKALPPEAVPDSPEKILLQLPRRKIPGVLLHQGQMSSPPCYNIDPLGVTVMPSQPSPSISMPRSTARPAAVTRSRPSLKDG